MSIRNSALAAFRLVPIQKAGEESPLRICLLARRSPDPVEGHLFLLRSTTDALVYLGCICDAAEVIREWVEIWVQSIEGLKNSFSSAQEPLSRERWDERWKSESRLLSEIEEERFIHTGWENQPASALAIQAGAAGSEPVMFNPEGGLLRVLSFCPFGFEEYLDLLGSESVQPRATETSRTIFESLGIVDPELLNKRGALLFGNSKNPGTRLIEIFYLKVQLLLAALEKVQAFVARQQLPFLGLTAESFRVRLAPLGSGLPVFWTADVGLARTGVAHALALPSGKARYFIRARTAGESVYLPPGISRFMQGSGTVRIRKVAKESEGTVIEGTMVPDEPRQFSPNDLLWLRLSLASGRLDLYGHVYSTESLASGEVRFLSLPENIPAEKQEALKAALGASLPPVPFEVVPVLSSPCDLYAMGVLAVRTLLVNGQNTLAVALDELLSLARESGSAAAKTLETRVAELFRKDERFAKGLGPHRLLHQALDPKTAFESLPEELWHEALAELVRFFPGATPESHCRDWGDAPPLALETVFAGPIAALRRLLGRSRSLIFGDWKTNREIHAVIRGIKRNQPKG
ncbi:MAG TPA: hypothetical protein VGR78_13315 [Verrucomicrobiae bacterium]|nr:hypothetical protein [Verrucomicrobiae bacterium]